MEIEIVRHEVKKRSRKLGGVRRRGRGPSARKLKRSIQYLVWRYQRFPDHSYTIYPEYI